MFFQIPAYPESRCLADFKPISSVSILSSGTVMSYKQGPHLNVFRFITGPRITLEVWGVRKVTNIAMIAHELTHLTWTFSFQSKYRQHYLACDISNRG